MSDSRRTDEARRHRTLAVIAIAGVVVAAIGVAVSVYLASRPDTPDERVAACQKKHNAPARRDLPGGGEAYSHCSWPPVRSAAKDGFYEITVRYFNIPGSSNIEVYSTVAVYEVDCRKVRLQYEFAHMVAIPEPQPPIVVANDGVFSYESGMPLDPDDEGLAYPVPEGTPGKLVIYQSGRYPLKSVECAAIASP